MISIADNFQKVSRRIQKATREAGRRPGSVQLLAVSKKQPASAIRELAAQGHHRVGENYVQEAIDKMSELKDLPLEWHFIGPIQSNKTRAIAEHFDCVQSVDRLKIAQRLNDQRPPDTDPLDVCIQVNIDDEASKSGVAPSEVPPLADAIMALPALRLRGLMAIPDPHQPEPRLRQSFRRLAELLANLQRDWPGAEELDVLSMGMSGDMELAIAEGATLVRVGTALFGPRDY
ncbi:YggS family pyridoxal phosphate-dependent enzyme [Marinobacteraceae bacterium S3BR75-40.1]